MGTSVNQTSMSRLISLNSIDDLCVLLCDMYVTRR